MHSSTSTDTLLPGRIRRHLVTLGIAALAAGAIVGGSAASASASASTYAKDLGGASVQSCPGGDFRTRCDLGITSPSA